MIHFLTYRLRRTTLLSVGLTSLLVGLFLAYYNTAIQTVWLLSVPALVFILYKFEGLRLLAVIFLGLIIGLWRGGVMSVELKQYDQFYGNKVVFIGSVSDDSGYSEQRRQTEFHVSNLSAEGQKLPGRIQVGVREDPNLTRGDQVVVSGKLKPSIGTSRQGAVSMAEVTILSKNTSWLERSRRAFFQSVANALPEPQASLGIGYLVGLRVNIPKELNDQLAAVGLTHIIAVSGYNVTILVRAVRRMFGKRSAYQSVTASLFLVGGFVLVAGGSPSINRAAIVCVFSLLAWYYGREFKPLLLLLLSGAITGFVNPLYIWGDPGWWLSFLAFAGVLILAPLIIRRYFTTKPPGTTSQILIETICAQACTIPYTMHLFGGVSLIAPLANVLVLPFIPFIMFAVFVLGFLGMLAPMLATYFGFIPSSLLTLQLWLVERLSNVPWAHREVTISAGVMIILFVALTLFTLTLNWRVKRQPQSESPEIEYNLV